MTAFKKVSIPSIFIKGYGNVRPLDNDILKALQDLSLNLDAILNRGIRFEDNVDARLITFTSDAVADAENTVAHDLGKVPDGFLVYSLDKAAIVYNGATPFTDTNIYLKVSAATVAVGIIVF